MKHVFGFLVTTVLGLNAGAGPIGSSGPTGFMHLDCKGNTSAGEILVQAKVLRDPSVGIYLVVANPTTETFLIDYVLVTMEETSEGLIFSNEQATVVVPDNSQLSYSATITSSAVNNGTPLNLNCSKQ